MRLHRIHKREAVHSGIYHQRPALMVEYTGIRLADLEKACKHCDELSLLKWEGMWVEHIPGRGTFLFMCSAVYDDNVAPIVKRYEDHMKLQRKTPRIYKSSTADGRL